MSLDAMKQALITLEWNLPVLEDYGDHEQLNRQHKAITALRAAIEQTNDWDEVEALRASLREHMAEIHRLRAAIEQAQEPVATVISESGNPNVSMSWWHEPALPVGTNIYTSPQPSKPWVGLTDEEIAEMHNEIKVRLMGTYRTEDIYRAIEAKLREKNGGSV